MFPPIVLCFMLLPAYSDGLLEGKPVYRANNAKYSVQSESDKVELFPAARRFSEISGTAVTVTDHVTRTRNKRATKIIGYATVKALRALKALLRKSQRLPDRDKYTRQYLKDGSYLIAMKDFTSFRPIKLSVYTLPREIKVLEGEAGEMIIRLTAEGPSGLPELDVLKKLKAGDELAPIDKIMYVEK